MAFDITLRDNGVGTFDIDIRLSDLTATERTITFLGLVVSQISDSTETFSVFVE
jgi:hypothetical protein